MSTGRDIPHSNSGRSGAASSYPAPPQHPRRVPGGGSAQPAGRSWILWLGVVVAAGIVLALILKPAQSKKAAYSPAIPVSTAVVKKGSIDLTLLGLGTVTPISTVTVSSRVAGALTEIHYTEGQLVKKGDLLAVIDPRPYEATLLQAEGQLAKDQALLADAKLDLARYEEAYREHAIPEQQLATQQATVAGDEGAVTVDQGNLEAAQVNVDYTHITSPIDGQVGLREVDLGNIVPANGTTGLVVLTQLQPITVVFTLAEDQIGDVTDAMKAGHPLKVEALDRTLEHVLAVGSLLTLDNQVNVTTGTVRAKAVFANAKNELFPNQFVNARLYLRTLSGVDLIPTGAVQRDNDSTEVYVVGSDQTVQLKKVVVTASQGDTSAVTGLEPGQVVVTDGFDRLQNGAKIRSRRR